MHRTGLREQPIRQGTIADYYVHLTVTCIEFGALTRWRRHIRHRWGTFTSIWDGEGLRTRLQGQGPSRLAPWLLDPVIAYLTPVGAVGQSGTPSSRCTPVLLSIPLTIR